MIFVRRNSTLVLKPLKVQSMFVAARFLSSESHKRKKPKEERIFRIKGEILAGYHSVRLAMENPNRRIHKVYYSADSERISQIVELCEIKGIPAVKANRNFLDRFSERDYHRGVCADADPLEPVQVSEKSLSSILSSSESFWLMLSSIGDPFNMGAIIRSAYFLGVDRLFVCSPWDGKQSSAPLNASTSRCSSGVLEIFTPQFVANSEAFLDSLKGNGWQITGAMPALENSHDNEQDFIQPAAEKTLLIVGHEGAGIAPSLVQKCDKFESIISPRRQLHSCVDSLNVSVATALLIDRIKRSQQSR